MIIHIQLFFVNLSLKLKDWHLFSLNCLVLGMPYDYGIDLWSVAVSLYELYTGKIMFPGRSNNEMLKQFMDFRGKLPNKYIKRAVLKEKHFDADCNFIYRETDKITKFVSKYKV